MTEVVRYITCPIEVFNDHRMDAIEKMLLIRIDSFCKHGDGDGCYASNDYLAEFCGCSERKVSASLTHLKELGYIEQRAFDGRRRTLWSRLADIAILPSTKCEADTQILRVEKKESSNKRKDIYKPSLEEVRAYVKEKGYHFSADEFFNYYDSANWHKADGKPVRNWKQCCVTWESNHKPSQSQTVGDHRKRLV